MAELVTLHRSDPDFEKYIWGTFSKDKKALPIESLNVATENEKVTFQIVNNHEIVKPSWLICWAQILKIKNFIWVLLPLFLVLIKNVLDASLEDPILAFTSALGAIFLHGAMNLQNDIQDHVRGLDRINSRAGSRALQNGWVTAKKLKTISRWLMLLGLLLGLPSIFLFPQILWIVLPLIILGLIGLMFYNMGLKYRAWSEWVVFLMLGPLLTTGYQISIGAGVDLEVIFLGVITGWLAVFILHLKNFEFLILGSQAQFNNTVTRLGFEKSKKLINMWWIAFTGLFVCYHGIFTSNLWMWMTAIFIVLVSIPLLGAVVQIDSPVGSKVQRGLFIANQTVQMVLAIWILENVWYFFLWEVW
jgi:1,4-dihydroxy-2-naphthoate octaprenyltransferase